MHIVIRTLTHVPIVLNSKSSVEEREDPEECSLCESHLAAGFNSTKNFSSWYFLILLTQCKCDKDNDEGDKEPKYPEYCAHLITSVAIGQPARIIRRRFNGVSIHYNWNNRQSEGRRTSCSSNAEVFE